MQLSVHNLKIFNILVSKGTLAYILHYLFYNGNVDINRFILI